MLMKDFLQNVVRTPDLLRLGYQVVLDKLKHENYRRQTLELLVEGSFEYVTVLTQNVYQQLWAELQQSEQQQTRLSVVQAVARNHTNRKYLQSLAIFASKLHNIEGYQEWLQLYRQLLVQLQPTTVMEYFLVLFRQSDDRISPMGEFLLPYLYNLLRSNIRNLAPTELEKVFLLVYLIIKSLSYLEDCNPEIVRTVLQVPLEGWMQIFIDVLNNSPSAILQKYTAKTLTSMLADLPQLCSKYLLSLVYPIWMLFNRSVVGYMTESMRNTTTQATMESTMQDKYLKEIRFEQNTAGEGLVYQLIELIRTLFCMKGLEILQRLSIHLLFNSFYNLLLITQVDEKAWVHDENKFITDADDQQTLCLRNQIIQSIMDFIELNPETLSVIRTIIENGFADGSQQTLKQITKTAMLKHVQSILATGEAGALCLSQDQLTLLVESCFVSDELARKWTRKQVAILLIYYSADELFEGEQEKQRQIVLSVLANLITDTNQHSLLRIQALRTLTKCSAAVQPQQHVLLLGYCLELLNSTHAGMRIMSVRSIGSFVSALRRNGLGNSLSLTDLQLGTIIDVGKYLNGETMHILLETCVQLAKVNVQTNQQLARLLEPCSMQLLETYYGEGLLSSNMLALFGQLTIPSVQRSIAKFLAQGSHHPKHSELRSLYIQLLKKYIEAHSWTTSFSQADLLVVVKSLIKDEQAVGLVRQYLQYGSIDLQLRNYLCNNACDCSWVIPALKRDIPIDAKAHLVSAVKKILEVTSQHELECELVLPLCMLYKSPAQYSEFLKAQGLFIPFTGKWVKYLPLFQGEMLKRTSILTLIRLKDSATQQFVTTYLRENRKQLQMGDLNWEDDLEENMEELRIDDDDWLDRRMVNDFVEKELREDLPEVAAIDLQQELDRYLA